MVKLEEAREKRPLITVHVMENDLAVTGCNQRNAFALLPLLENE